MEEPGEQCVVVFVLIVTEPASDCVSVYGRGGGRGGGVALTPTASSVTIYEKTTVHFSPDSSMLL
jgi:hypothetical protein